MHSLAFLKAGAAFAAAGILGIFGGHVSPTAIHSATSTPPMHRQVDIACVASAVAARESALDSAVTTRDNAITAAYPARASALAAAYAQTATSSIQSSVKTAWTTFNASVKTARSDWRSSQLAAWQSFATAARACGASNAAIISDMSHENDDAADGD